MSENPIVVERITHLYPGGVLALKETSLNVLPGEVLGVVGQNGSGKTTLVKHFNGLLRPTTGRLLIKGEDSRGKPMYELARRVGYVFQNPNHQLFATSVKAELGFGPTSSTMLERHPYRLAFPQRKLVGMASIYAMDPDVFVLDEPTTGQDHAGSLLVRKLVARLREQGKTVIIVSHDMALIAEVADRLVALWSAEVIAVGTPREIFANDSVMQRTKLNPPQITQFARQRWPNDPHRLALSVSEAVAALSEAPVLTEKP